MRKKVLHIVGSLNQTKQLYSISQHMPEVDHYFTQFFGSGRLFKWVAESGLVDFTILGTKSNFRADQESFLQSIGAKYDYRGTSLGNTYDLVFICSDLMVPSEIKYAKIIYIQEGMTDPFTWQSWLVHKLGLPAWFAGDTSLNGCSNVCDIYCVASQGYADFFAKMGTDAHKIVVTGIPNFDHAASHLSNEFRHKDYVLVCTSDLREVGKKDDRLGFLRRCKSIAGSRQIIFKLHPNEKIERATSEIYQVLGSDTLIYTKGNTDDMIANCDELITQYSSCVYIGMALGKKVHSYFPMSLLTQRMPVQNGGTSAKTIAEIGLRYLEHDGQVRALFPADKEWKPSFLPAQSSVCVK